MSDFLNDPLQNVLKAPGFSLFSNLSSTPKTSQKKAFVKKEPLPKNPVSYVTPKKPNRLSAEEKKPLAKPETILAEEKSLPKLKEPFQSSYKTPKRSFASMEKLIASIDPTLNIYKEDVETQRKKVFVSFPIATEKQEKDALFYTKLKSAIEGRLADTEQVDCDGLKNLEDYSSIFDQAHLILLAHETFHNSLLKTDSEISPLIKKEGYGLGAFNDKPLIILEPVSAYDNPALKKSLWSYLQELLHGG